MNLSDTHKQLIAAGINPERSEAKLLPRDMSNFCEFYGSEDQLPDQLQSSLSSDPPH
jgi:hypothetical protein